jgi:hypothetical protein
VRQAYIISYSISSLSIIRGAAGIAAWLPGIGTGIMLLKVASALNSL